jgi:hypothetical protein
MRLDLSLSFAGPSCFQSPSRQAMGDNPAANAAQPRTDTKKAETMIASAG